MRALLSSLLFNTPRTKCDLKSCGAQKPNQKHLKVPKNNNWYVTTLQREGRLTLMHVNKFFQFRLKGVTDRKPILPFRYLVAAGDAGVDAGDAGAGDADDADAGASRLLDSRRLSSPWCGDALPPNICCSQENIDKYFQIHICSPLKSVSSGKMLTNISRSISAARWKVFPPISAAARKMPNLTKVTI